MADGLHYLPTYPSVIPVPGERRTVVMDADEFAHSFGDQIADAIASRLCGDLPGAFCDSLKTGASRQWAFSFYGLNAAYPCQLTLTVNCDGSLSIQIADATLCPVWRKDLRRCD